MGGVTAAATAVGAFAPAAQVASAAPDSVDSNAAAGGVLGLSQEGVFDSCSAYFGFGKEDGVINATAFTVTDSEGDDDGSHAVPDDVDVVLVIETEGGVIECVPEEVTEEEWQQFLDDSSFFGPLRPWPGEGHYGYPSVAADEEPEEGLNPTAIDDFGAVTAVGFRVVGFPADHRLVSPQGIQPLPDHFAGALDTDLDFDDDVLDPRVLEVAAAEAGAAAAAAFGAAFDACIAGADYDDDDPDLIAAAEALIDYMFGGDGTDLDSVTCDDIAAIEEAMQFIGAVDAAATHVEGIILAGPVAPTPPAPAAQPSVAAPTFTG